jgi:hypothetical protein
MDERASELAQVISEAFLSFIIRPKRLEAASTLLPIGLVGRMPTPRAK